MGNSTLGFPLFPVRVAQRAIVYERLRSAGVGVQVHYVPLYRHPLYAPFANGAGGFPATEAAYAGLLSLPMFPVLSDAQQDFVVRTLENAVGGRE